MIPMLEMTRVSKLQLKVLEYASEVSAETLEIYKNNSDECFICLNNNDHDNARPLFLGCACRRVAHLTCAKKWYFTRTIKLDINIHKLHAFSPHEKAICYSCACETCKAQLGTKLLKLFDEMKPRRTLREYFDFGGYELMIPLVFILMVYLQWHINRIIFDYHPLRCQDLNGVLLCHKK